MAFIHGNNFNIQFVFNTLTDTKNNFISVTFLFCPGADILTFGGGGVGWGLERLRIGIISS